jgi:fructose-1,6-bisphosphatase/inositol monophosphatase family enzyme
VPPRLRDEPALLHAIKAIHEAIRAEVLAACARASTEDMAAVTGKQAGDVIYGVDRVTERVLVDRFAALAKTWPCLLVAEGLGVSGRRVLPDGTPESAVEIVAIVDPIDGTRA